MQNQKQWRPLNINDVYALENQIKDQGTLIYRAALMYASAGLYVIPLQKNSKILPPSDMNVNYGHASRKPQTIENWFNPLEGKFRGWNIGIATGREDGIFVLDIDRHGDDDGFKTLEMLENKHGSLPDCPVQRSPNGGAHYLFAWQENLINSTNKIGQAIDSRGGQSNACKGHIVAWPSVVNGKMYEWEKMGSIPDIPQWIADIFGVVWKPKGRGRGNENVGIDDIEQQIPIEQVQRMLDSIDPNSVSYEEWLRIGLSIKSQYQGDDGLELWDGWSKNGTRYKSGECHLRWNGFADVGTVRMGTLWYIATQHGWEPQDEDKTANRYDVLVEEMNANHAVVTVGGKVRILRDKAHLASPMDQHYDLFDKDSFRILMDNNRVEIVDDRGNLRRVSMADMWLAHENRRTYSAGLGLFPDGKVPPDTYNTWRGFSVKSKEGKCDGFLNHVRTVIAGGDDTYYNWILDWCSDAVQDPANPKGTCIVLRGPEGSGKGTFANTMGELFGSHYRHLIDDSHLLSNFNAHMIDALFVFADEITWGGNKKTAGKLKGMVTEKYLVGERKGVDAVGYRNMIHMVIASNSDWVIPAGTNSRRWFVIDTPGTYSKDPAYFKAIYSELNNGGREALLYFLLNRKITANLTRAPETAALHEQRQRSVVDDNTVIGWWMHRLDVGSMDVADLDYDPNNRKQNPWPAVVRKPDLYANYEDWCGNRHRPVSISVFSLELNKLGIGTKKARRGDARIPVYEIPPIEWGRKFVKDVFNLTVGEDDDENED